MSLTDLSWFGAGLKTVMLLLRIQDELQVNALAEGRRPFEGMSGAFLR